MQTYHAAARLAGDMVLEHDDLDAVVGAWEESYTSMFRRSPEAAEVAEAKQILAQRLEYRPPDLPPSASSTAMTLPPLIGGVPKARGEPLGDGARDVDDVQRSLCKLAHAEDRVDGARTQADDG